MEMTLQTPLTTLRLLARISDIHRRSAFLFASALSQKKQLFWQKEGLPDSLFNGRYEKCNRRWTDEKGEAKDTPMWRRVPAVGPDASVIINANELQSGLV